MVNSSIQSKIIAVLMQPEGMPRSRLEIAHLAGISQASVYRALRNGIRGVVKAEEVRTSNTKSAEMYYWDSEVFADQKKADIVNTQISKENVIQMPIKNNSTALKVTDLSGIPKDAMAHLTNSLNTISPDAIHAFRRVRDRISDMDDSWSPENVRKQLIVTCGVVMQMCIDMGKQSDEPIAPQANQKDSDNS